MKNQSIIFFLDYGKFFLKFNNRKAFVFVQILNNKFDSVLRTCLHSTQQLFLCIIVSAAETWSTSTRINIGRIRLFLLHPDQALIIWRMILQRIWRSDDCQHLAHDPHLVLQQLGQLDVFATKLSSQASKSQVFRLRRKIFKIVLNLNLTI